MSFTVITTPTNSRPTYRRRGFTLIEAALTTVIIGIGVLAMLELLATGTSSNIDSSKLTTAINLAKQVREIAIQKTFEEVVAMEGDVYDPPRDGSGLPIDSLSGWKQSVTVHPVDPDYLLLEIIDDAPQAVRVTVTISHNEQKVAEVDWNRFQ